MTISFLQPQGQNSIASPQGPFMRGQAGLPGAPGLQGLPGLPGTPGIPGTSPAVATVAQAVAGLDNTTMMTPARAALAARVQSLIFG